MEWAETLRKAESKPSKFKLCLAHLTSAPMADWNFCGPTNCSLMFIIWLSVHSKPIQISWTSRPSLKQKLPMRPKQSKSLQDHSHGELIMWRNLRMSPRNTILEHCFVTRLILVLGSPLWATLTDDTNKSHAVMTRWLQWADWISHFQAELMIFHTILYYSMMSIIFFHFMTILRCIDCVFLQPWAVSSATQRHVRIL